MLKLQEFMVSLQFTSADSRDLIPAILLTERAYPGRHVA